MIDGTYASSLPIWLAPANTVVFLGLPAHLPVGSAQQQLRQGSGQVKAIGV